MIFKENENLIDELIEKIQNLKTDLKREQECVDFYATETMWINKNYSDAITGSLIHYDNGDKARETQRRRRIE